MTHHGAASASGAGSARVLDGVPPAWMADLFAVLWAELDLDDHPLHGGHGLAPEGELRLQLEPDALRLLDARADLILAMSRAGLAGAIEATAPGRVWFGTVLTTQPLHLRPPPGRGGTHRWTLPVDWLSDDLVAALRELGMTPTDDEDLDGDWPVVWEDRSAHAAPGLDLAWRDVFSDAPPEWDERTASAGLGWWDGALVGGWRALLQRLRTTCSPLLPGWSWHLEVDNKPDRTGWYIRSPAHDSLFTVVLGLRWPPARPNEAEGLVLVERAPPGELDRPDQAPENAADARRTAALEAPDGAVSRLAGETMAEAVAKVDLPPIDAAAGSLQVWPSSLGHWPLVWATSGPPGSIERLEAWLQATLTRLAPILAAVAAPE